MNRILMLAGLFLFGFVSPAEAVTENCVPDEGCPKVEEGMEQPDCCRKPPCELEEAWKFAKANLHNINSHSLAFALDDAPDADSRYETTRDKDFDELASQISKCTENSSYNSPPTLDVDQYAGDPQCDILIIDDFGEKHEAPTLDELQNSSDACSEIVEARYHEAKITRDICLVNLYRTKPRTLNERIQQALARAQAKFDVLEEHIQRYRKRCSVPPDLEEAQQVVEDDLAPLIATPPKKAMKKKGPPKKAKKSGKRVR